LIVKTYRIYKIFNLKKLKIQTLTQLHLLKWLGILLTIELIIRVINEAVSPFTLTAAATPADADWTYYTYCYSKYRNYFLVLSFGYKGILLLFGIFLAFQVKDVEKNFNESKLLGVTIYNCSFLGVVALPVLFALSSNDPIAYTAILVVSINYVAIFTLIVLTGSKLYVIYYRLEETVGGAAQTRGMKSEIDELEATRTVTTSGRRSIEDEPWNLQRFEETLNKQLSKLRLVSQNRAEQFAMAAECLENAVVAIRKDGRSPLHAPNSPSQ